MVVGAKRWQFVVAFAMIATMFRQFMPKVTPMVDGGVDLVGCAWLWIELCDRNMLSPTT